MSEDTYAGFAGRYDLFHESFDEHSPERVEFFKRVFADHHVEALLDCACGTGRDLALFHSLGLKVSGSDISDAMLAVARRNLSQLGREIIRKADYRELENHYGSEFDAVVCLSSSLLEMPDETEALKALSSMRSVLRDGGILVLSQGTTDKMWAEKPRFIPVVNRPGFSRVFVIDYTERGARFNVMDLYHDEFLTDFKVWTKEYRRVILKRDYERLLKEAGYKRADFYGAYNLSPYDEGSSEILLCVAHG